MKKILFTLFIAVGILALSACDEGTYEKTTGPDEFSLLTYNVAGLPQGISQSNPQTNIPKISPKLNLFDIVLAQEDFFYHLFLKSKDGHPYESEFDYFHGLLGDGLNRFSYCDFDNFTRVTWALRNGLFDDGSDELTPKGFSYATHEVAPGVFVDIYNLHHDAGGSAEDDEARSVQIDQLLDKLSTYSAGKAVIMAGDWNMHMSDSENNMSRMVTIGGMTDVGIDLAGVDRIDKVLYKNSDDVILTPLEYAAEVETFADSNGDPLSDHDAISVLFKWESPNALVCRDVCHKEKRGCNTETVCVEVCE
ncbi:MAG: hypothetical protein GY754_40365 [bacterium]|nr:hypothetical protein [bacterium]